jgi:hypothetical protein
MNGVLVGTSVGAADGGLLGSVEGPSDGFFVGACDGALLGSVVGPSVGFFVGKGWLCGWFTARFTGW